MLVTHDFETKSYADLKKVGAWVYSEHPTTMPICLGYKIGDAPSRLWWPSNADGAQCPGATVRDAIPNDLLKALRDGVPFEAHNISFERAIWQNIMVERYDWPAIGTHQYRDVMAVASYLALPPALDQLSRALGRPGKNPDGARLISKYSKLYLKTAKTVIPPEDFEKWGRYCLDDVEEEAIISSYLGDLPEEELEMFRFDQEVNLRGLYLDQAGIDKATAIVDQRSADLEVEFIKLVGQGPTKRDKVMRWFEDQGFPLDNMQADYLEELLEDESVTLPKSCRRALEIRLQINKASTKKLDAMARAVSRDGTAKFQTRFHGAQTGRNTGTGLQPLNLNRGWEKVDPEQLVRDIMHGDASWLDMLYGDALDAIAKASRHWITAPEGEKLMSGDFVSVEAVILACLAGEDWKVDMFRRKEPVYELMGCKIHGLGDDARALAIADKDKFKARYGAERQDGKTGELAFGYQGALVAWRNFDKSDRHTDEAIIDICKTWRREHPNVAAMWYGMEGAAIEAVQHPGRVTGCRGIGFEMVDEWLSMILPNGKRIWYFAPRLHVKMPRWHDPVTKLKCAEGTCDCEPQPRLAYMAQKFGQWKLVTTYGGKLTENAVQAVSRERLKPSALAADRAGYKVILTVYDEIVARVPANFGSVKEFEDIMREPPRWCEAWPINVDAWEGRRYKK